MNRLLSLSATNIPLARLQNLQPCSSRCVPLANHARRPSNHGRTLVTGLRLLSLIGLGWLLIGSPVRAAERDSPASQVTRKSTSGEQKRESEPGPLLIGVAVIDLNRVAIGLGRLQTMEQEIAEHREFLTDQVRLVDADYAKRIEQRRGEKATPGTEQKTADQWRVERQQAVAQAQREAARRLGEFEQTVKQRFMDEVRPVAHEVAAEHGFGIVLTVPQVFAYRVGSNQDITDRVVKRLQKTAATAKSPTANAATDRAATDREALRLPSGTAPSGTEQKSRTQGQER